MPLFQVSSSRVNQVVRDMKAAGEVRTRRATTAHNSPTIFTVIRWQQTQRETPLVLSSASAVDERPGAQSDDRLTEPTDDKQAALPHPSALPDYFGKISNNARRVYRRYTDGSRPCADATTTQLRIQEWLDAGVPEATIERAIGHCFATIPDRTNRPFPDDFFRDAIRSFWEDAA